MIIRKIPGVKGKSYKQNRFLLGSVTSRQDMQLAEIRHLSTKIRIYWKQHPHIQDVIVDSYYVILVNILNMLNYFLTTNYKIKGPFLVNYTSIFMSAGTSSLQQSFVIHRYLFLFHALAWLSEMFLILY